LTFPQDTLPSAVAAAGRGVFVGRASEVAVLEAAAAAARRGQPQVVLVEGEAGIGKSTLLTRFAAGLAGATVLPTVHKRGRQVRYQRWLLRRGGRESPHGYEGRQVVASTS
jgi:MoxR-like ATPase